MAPAFIRRPPPRLPGMPSRNSRPLNPWRRASAANEQMLAGRHGRLLAGYLFNRNRGTAAVRNMILADIPWKGEQRKVNAELLALCRELGA